MLMNMRDCLLFVITKLTVLTLKVPINVLVLMVILGMAKISYPVQIFVIVLYGETVLIVFRSDISH